MRKIIETTNVYKFEELSDDAKKKALDNHRYFLVSSDFWDEFELCDMKEELTQMGFNGANIHYSGFASQGDGLCFTCDDIDILEVLPNIICSYNFPSERMEKRLIILAQNGLCGNFEITKNDWRYSHHHTVHANCMDDYNLIPLEVGLLEDGIDRLSRSIMKRFYRRLEVLYDLLTSDAYLQELLNNETGDNYNFEFLESGELFEKR